MARVVLATPHLASEQPGDLWPGIAMTWAGWDGSVWDLFDRRAGVYLRSGVRGLGVGPHDRYTSTSPALPGSRFLGARAAEREVFWPFSVRVGPEVGSEGWIALDSSFWRTLDPEQVGTWTVTQPSGEVRALPLRYTPTPGDDVVTVDPTRRGFQQYGVYLVAEQPYWSGELVSQVFVPSDPLDFLPPTGGPPLRISEGSLTSSATIPNRGQVAAPVEWWITSADSAVVGVDGRLVDVPFEVASGRMLVIDSDPTVRTAIEIDAPALTAPVEDQRAWVDSHLPGGVNRTKELGPTTKWGQVPPSAAADLSITVIGAGAQVRASLVPRFHRAW